MGKVRGKYHFVNTAHALEVVLAEIAQANLIEKVLLPALYAAINTNRYVTLLTNGTAEAAGLATGCHVCESISEIVELALVEQLLGHVVLEPEDLGNLHLNAHRSTDISQEVVVGGINLLGLFDGSVVQP